LGAIPNAQPFATIRNAAQSSSRAKATIGHANFSDAIRAGLPKAGLF